jgi:hypothetical protein
VEVFDPASTRVGSLSLWSHFIPCSLNMQCWHTFLSLILLRISLQIFWSENLNETLWRHRCRWGIILKYIPKICVERVWNGLIWFRIKTSGGFFNKISGSVKGGEFE